jgi:hypothetical protein
LLAMWGSVRDPFAVRPIVVVSYGRIADRIGLAGVSLPRIVRRLVEFDCVRRVGHSPSGTSYELQRPQHLDTDVQLNPFEPSAAHGVASEVVDLLVQTGRLRNRPRVRKARTKLPRIRPDRIAAMLEDVAGMEPRYHPAGLRTGQRKPVLPYSRKAGDPSGVEAAQRFIAEHGWALFTEICSTAIGRPLLGLETKDERAHLFERPKALAEIEQLVATERGKQAELANAQETVQLVTRLAAIEITDEMRAEYEGASDEDIRAWLVG